VSPSLRKKPNLKRPWHARANRHGVEYSLGYYTTQAEALAVERQFAVDYPTDPKGWRHRWDPDTVTITISRDDAAYMAEDEWTDDRLRRIALTCHAALEGER